MSFNPMMTALVRGVADLVEPEATVIELGNQTFKADDETLRRVIDHPPGPAPIDRAGLEALLRLPAAERGDRTEAYYRCLGFRGYDAIDVNDTYGSLVMDLNRDLRETHGFERTFSLVTNNGTGEHVFNQLAVFANMHALTRAGGVQMFLLPFVNYINHGFFSFHPNLFHALARANGYRLIALGLGNRHGHGVVARPDPETVRFTPPLLVTDEVSLATVLGKAKGPRSGTWPRVKQLARRLKGTTRSSTHLGTAIGRLRRTHGDLLVFAVMRKLEDRPFRIPIQGTYSDAISDAEIQAAYAESRDEAKT